MGEILDTEIQEWSDEKLAAEYLNKSRKFVSQLHSKELYSENPSWQNTREPRLRGDDVEMRIIVSPIVESYMQLLEECFRRRLAEPIYSECLTMTLLLFDRSTTTLFPYQRVHGTPCRICLYENLSTIFYQLMTILSYQRGT